MAMIFRSDDQLEPAYTIGSQMTSVPPPSRRQPRPTPTGREFWRVGISAPGVRLGHIRTALGRSGASA